MVWRRLWVSIVGSILDEDLKRPEVMSVREHYGWGALPAVLRQVLLGDMERNAELDIWIGSATEHPASDRDPR